MAKLQLGCGQDYKKGFVNLDSSKLVNPDVVWDLEKTPLPFKNNEFEFILANHVLEHVKNFTPLVHEMHRITKKGGKIKVRTPFFSAWGQFNDPTHVRFFTPWTFTYFRKGTYAHEVGNDKDMFEIENVRIHFGIGATKKLNWFIDPIINFNQRFYCRFFAWIFPAAEIEYDLKVLK